MLLSSIYSTQSGAIFFAVCIKSLAGVCPQSNYHSLNDLQISIGWFFDLIIERSTKIFGGQHSGLAITQIVRIKSGCLWESLPIQKFDMISIIYLVRGYSW